MTGGAYPQPIPNGPTVAADATGSATFTFPPPAPSETWTGAVNVPNAPASATFAAYLTAVTGTPLATWQGRNTARGIQALTGQPLIVVGHGLLPGVNYAAQWQGNVTANDDVTAATDSQNPNVSSVTEQLLLGGPVPVNNGTTEVVTLVSTWRSLWVATFNTLTPAPTVVGNQSGVSYDAFTPPYASNVGFFRFPIIEGLDTSVTITFGTFASAAWWGADLADIDTAIYPDSGAGLPIVFPTSQLPIPVNNYGGGRFISPTTIAAGTTVLMLNTPLLANIYSLRRWVATATGVAPNAGDVRIGQGSAVPSLVAPVDATVFGSLPFGRDLSECTITGGRVAILNNTNQSVDFTLWYDIVPAI